MLLTFAFFKENSAISLEECVLVFKVFTTATRKLRVKPHYTTFHSLTVDLDDPQSLYQPHEGRQAEEDPHLVLSRLPQRQRQENDGVHRQRRHAQQPSTGVTGQPAENGCGEHGGQSPAGHDVADHVYSEGAADVGLWDRRAIGQIVSMVSFVLFSFFFFFFF